MEKVTASMPHEATMNIQNVPARPPLTIEYMKPTMVISHELLTTLEYPMLV